MSNRVAWYFIILHFVDLEFSPIFILAIFVLVDRGVIENAGKVCSRTGYHSNVDTDTHI